MCLLRHFVSKIETDMIPIGDGNENVARCTFMPAIETDMIPIGDGNGYLLCGEFANSIETDMIPIGDGNQMPWIIFSSSSVLRQT